MGSRLRYLLALVALPAFAAEPAGVTVTRTPAGKELEPPKDPGPGATAAKVESYDGAKLGWDKWVDALTRSDVVARRELAAVQACYKGEPTKATVKLTIEADAKVHGVSVGKGTNPELAACFTSVYKDQRLPFFTSVQTRTDFVLDWTVEIGPAAAPAAAIDRDLGVGATDFGAAPESLGSVMEGSSTSFIKVYSRQLDPGVRWFGVTLAAATYAFDTNKEFAFAILEVTGSAAAYSLRQSIKERYGQPKWDGLVRKWYWRGNDVLIDTIDITTGDGGVQVWVVDMSRLRATDAGLRFPGDPVDSANQGPRLPSIFQHQGQSPDGNPSGSP